MLELLLDYEVDPNDWGGDSGISPLILAIQNTNTDIITKMLTILIQNGADPNATPGTAASGHTPLHESVYQLNAACIKLLLDNGANHTIKDYDGLTPLELLENKKKEEEIAISNMEHPLQEHNNELQIINDCINTFTAFIAKNVPAVSGGTAVVAGGRRRKTFRQKHRKCKPTKKRRKKKRSRVMSQKHK